MEDLVPSSAPRLSNLARDTETGVCKSRLGEEVCVSGTGESSEIRCNRTH